MQFLKAKSVMTNNEVEVDDPLCLVFTPPLVALLYKLEKERGAPLTEEEVLKIRDHAVCMNVPYSEAIAQEKARGFPDLIAENCWEDWQEARKVLFK
jgi:hypothetical protein